MLIFWCKFTDGRTNSVSADNLIDAQRRARALNAEKLFGKNVASGKTFQVRI